MNSKITNAFKATKGFLCKHSPEILTGIGVTGMIGSTVLAVKATPKALQLLEEAKTKKGEELSVKETIMVGWKSYIPSIALGVAGISCIIGASTVNVKRNAALATAYALSEKTLITYRDKVIETIGEKKEKEIREKISQDDVTKNPTGNTQVFITSKGNTLCRDSISGRYFRSDLDKIRKVINELNRDMNNHNYISLDEFYYALGLDSTSTSSRMGWNVDDGLIEINFNTCLADNDEPCIVLDYERPPKYDFDKVW